VILSAVLSQVTAYAAGCLLFFSWQLPKWLYLWGEFDFLSYLKRL
jgi:hypothetical protein